MIDISSTSEPVVQPLDRRLPAPRPDLPVRVQPKVVVSVSLGTGKRNSRVETTLLGTPVILERIGVDGDQKKARRLFMELDGRVDALGFGGADLGVTINRRRYPFRSLEPLVAGLSTPIVDGGALRAVVERRCIQRAEALLPPITSRRALIITATDRYDLAQSFLDAGYSVLLGDFGFILGLPLPVRSMRLFHMATAALMPLFTRMPFESLYPSGAKQERTRPRLRRWFEWAGVVGGDFPLLRAHLPERLDGKVIVTNTVRPDDIDLLRARGALALVTSMPRIEGQSLGANVIEAALTAIAGKGRALTPDEIAALIGDEGLPPAVDLLNP